MKSEQDLVQLSLGLKIEESEEQKQAAIIYDRQDWPFPSIKSGRGVDEFRYQTHQELEAQKREEKRRKRKKGEMKLPVKELDASGVSTVPGTLEPNVNWEKLKKGIDEARRRMSWESDIFPG